MPREMDFEAKYKAGSAEPFEQKNQMFMRVRWEPELLEMGQQFYGVIKPSGKPGYRHEDYALRNAGWFLFTGFGFEFDRYTHSLFGWEDKRVGLCSLPEDLQFESDDAAYNANMVKKAALLFGACDVGICRFDKRWLYAKAYHPRQSKEFENTVPEDYRYVINMAVPMDYQYVKFAPTASSGGGTGNGYSKMAIAAGQLAQFIRQLGYKAIPSGNATALSIPYAIQAGLGELGRNGFLVTPKYGPRVRLCKVFTDLPLDCDRPIEFGVTEFCRVCKQCAKYCPSQAIPNGRRTEEALNKSNAGGALKWYVDGVKCFSFWAKNRAECGNCIRVCPFNKPMGLLHDISRWFIEKIPALDPLYVKADTFFGYHKQADLKTFWGTANLS